MDEKEFTKRAKELAANDLSWVFSKDINPDDMYVVWLSKVLQNNKALLSTDLVDGGYVEVTYDGNKELLYADTYKKFLNTSNGI